jgi:hypothetical protein
MTTGGAKHHDQVTSSGYATATRVAFFVIGVVGTSVLGAAFAKYPERVDSTTVFLGAAIVSVWACALLDAFNRRIWLFNDHIVYRNLFGCRSTIYYRDIIEMKEGTDRVILNATEGRSLTVLRRMENYQEIAAILAAKTGHVRARRSR